MISGDFRGTIETDEKGAIVCPICRRKIRGIRLQDQAEMKNINLQCNWCRNKFDIEITKTGQRFQSQRH